MDLEEAWREAMQEEERGNQNQPQQHLFTSSVATSALGAPVADGDDSYNEFSDDELLQSVPFANDAAPVVTPDPFVTPTFHSPPVTRGTTTTTSLSRPKAAPTQALLKTGASATAAPTTTRQHRKAAVQSRGVLDFPPTWTSSFMLRGDDGRVRWVTTAAVGAAACTIQGKQSSNHNKSRKRFREEEDAATVIEVRDDGDESVCDVAEVVEVDSSSGHEQAGVESEFDNDISVIEHTGSINGSNDDRLLSDSSDEEAPQRVEAQHFLRDGLHVKDMLRKLYAEEAERQAQQENSRRDEDTTEGLQTDINTVQRDVRDVPAPCEPFPIPQRATTSPRESGQQGTSPKARNTKTSSGELWVAKYSPKLFREVLSDESINLRLLQWLKSWDAYVFPEKNTSSGGTAAAEKWNPPSGGFASSFSSPSYKGNSVAKGAFPGPSATSASGAATLTAPATPPEERIAVLTGPPGVGKTTLVHVLAAHCGYEVIEVNASVERTASRLEALIRTAVSAAGPAPGGRARRPPTTTQSSSTTGLQSGKQKSATAVAGDAETTTVSGTIATASLLQHLLRPKCLVIDEMDGIASSSVAAFLVQLELHRPVFCLCNDFYVPSLRPLRQRCGHVYYLPPIRPQRLLARLEEIARRERINGLDQTALSVLITMSGGDVRSCLNTMQFINTVVNQEQQFGSGGSIAPSQRHTITELIRRMQGKDTRFALKECWQLLFTRPERSKAVQLLRQDYGVDYEGLVEAAVAQHHRQHFFESRHRQEREYGIGSAATSPNPLTDDADTVGGAGGRGSETRVGPFYGTQQHQSVALGFRVDPGYLYAAQHLARCPDTAGLLDGLQENYLHRPYTDYSFVRTSATAASFSQQDVVVAAAFQHPEVLMGAAERLSHVSALTCYVHCSTAARGCRIDFPREQAALRRLQSEAQHISQAFRSGCRPYITTFLSGEEVTSTDVAPMLLRCLFDRTLRLPAHAITSFNRLPPPDLRLLQASVARHVEYGLNYEKDRHFTPSFAGGSAVNRLDSLSPSNGEEDVPWKLTPELDKLIAGIVRPMEKTLQGGHSSGDGGGGVAGSSFFQRSRYGNRSTNHSTGQRNAHVGWSEPSGSYSGSSTGSASASSRPSLSSVLMPLNNEVRQILVGEIRQYQILQSVEFLKKQHQQQGHLRATTAGKCERTAANTDLEEVVSATAKEKRQREENETSDTSVGTLAPATTSVCARQGMGCVSTAKADDDSNDVPEARKVKVEEVKESRPVTRTAIRRDFFGRPIPDPPAAGTRTGSTSRAKTSTTTTTTSVSPSPSPSPIASGGGGGGFPRLQPPHVPSRQACVRYIYQDGSTNAVKMPAVLADF